MFDSFSGGAAARGAEHVPLHKVNICYSDVTVDFSSHIFIDYRDNRSEDVVDTSLDYSMAKNQFEREQPKPVLPQRTVFGTLANKRYFDTSEIVTSFRFLCFSQSRTRLLQFYSQTKKWLPSSSKQNS